jgi:hypothetical protein
VPHGNTHDGWILNIKHGIRGYDEKDRVSTHGPLLDRAELLLKMFETSLATLGFSATLSTLGIQLLNYLSLPPGIKRLGKVRTFKSHSQRRRKDTSSGRYIPGACSPISKK